MRVPARPVMISPDRLSGLGVRAASCRDLAILERVCYEYQRWVFSSTCELSFPRCHQVRGKSSRGRQILICARRLPYLPYSNASSGADSTMPVAHGPPFAKLRRKWPANNPIGDRCLEMSVTPDASNRLVAHLCESGTGSNMNLLLSFTAWAFHRHHDIGLVGHRWASVRILPCASYGSGSPWLRRQTFIRCDALQEPRCSGGRGTGN